MPFRSRVGNGRGTLAREADVRRGGIRGRPASKRSRAEELPARNHALLLLKVLAYDRNIRQRAGSAVTVGVLSQAGDRASEDRGATLRAAFEEVANDVVVASLPVRVKEVPFRNGADLEARLEALHPALLHVDVALAAALPEIVRLTRRLAVCTAGTRSMAEAGVAVGVAGRAGLVVNLAGARAGGADLDAALLAISEVIRD